MAADDLGPAGSDPLTRLTLLGERGKEPASKSILNAWVNQAQAQVGLDTGRLGWLVASTVVVAALQRAIDEEGRTRFLLKGGTYLQHRLSWSGRPTKDIDGMVRGDIDEFLAALDDALRMPWGPLALTRDAIEVINAPGKIIKPRRFDVLVSLKGQVWRRIQIEIAPDEAGASSEQDILTVPGLHHFGLPSPDHLVGNRHAVPDRAENPRRDRPARPTGPAQRPGPRHRRPATTARPGKRRTISYCCGSKTCMPVVVRVTRRGSPEARVPGTQMATHSDRPRALVPGLLGGRNSRWRHCLPRERGQRTQHLDRPDKRGRVTTLILLNVSPLDGTAVARLVSTVLGIPYFSDLSDAQ